MADQPSTVRTSDSSGPRRTRCGATGQPADHAALVVLILFEDDASQYVPRRYNAHEYAGAAGPFDDGDCFELVVDQLNRRIQPSR